jgi:putative nucleotidyltransferase with HDIG domain
MLASHRGRSARHPSEGTTASPFLHARFTRRSAAQCTKKSNPRSRFPPLAWRPPQSCCYAPIVNVEVANALGRIVELKDRSTAAHTWRVSMYAQAVAEAVGVDHTRVMNFMIGAVLHDLGKLDVPDEILAKPGSLAPDEYLLMQAHTVAGWERLRRLGVTEPLILGVVRSHHERIDGSGYPDGLAGEQIPLGARWFSVIDGFDAMTSLRPYRDAVGLDAAWHAMTEIESKAGSWYEPEAVRVFRDLLEAGRLDSTL